MEKTPSSIRDSLPRNLQEIIALKQQPITEELVAIAIAGVIKMARSQQQSLDDLCAQVLEDDNVLDVSQRLWLSDLLTQAWERIP